MKENNNRLFEPSTRLKSVPPYLFAKIDLIKQEELAKNRKLISLSIGDPDLPTPDFVLDKLVEAARRPENHRYPSYWGMPSFRKAISQWYKSRFDVSLNPDREVLPLIGSKEGIAHIPLAFVNPGEGVLVPDPGYPVYCTATIFAGGIPLIFKLTNENNFLPNFSEMEALLKKNIKTKLLFLNYPNNPTSAVANEQFFKEVVSFAKKHSLIVCHDNAYSEIYYDQKIQPSFLSTPDAKQVGCEFHSLSKTFNMTGWRVGFLVGNEEIITRLADLKTNIDSGIPNAIQEAGIAALNGYSDFSDKLRSIYQERRDILVPALRSAGLNCHVPNATFYVWARTPNDEDSEIYVSDLIRTKGVVATPGTGFGDGGRGYVRFTLCSDISTLKQVAELL
ncbi:MAG: LL-diaminopimelate aminotransferase [Candidatus Poribacteria bacterium]